MKENESKLSAVDEASVALETLHLSDIQADGLNPESIIANCSFACRDWAIGMKDHEDFLLAISEIANKTLEYHCEGKPIPRVILEIVEIIFEDIDANSTVTDQGPQTEDPEE